MLEEEFRDSLYLIHYFATPDSVYLKEGDGMYYIEGRPVGMKWKEERKSMTQQQRFKCLNQL